MLEKDISILAKISKYYGLEHSLASKAQNYVIHNQIKTDELYPEE